MEDRYEIVYVYKYTSPSGKVYVGITNDLKKRKIKHISDTNCGSKLAFHNAIRKYGIDSFSYEILSVCKNRELACELEKLLIKKYKARDRRFGYNISEGGDGFGSGEDNPFYGCHHSKESGLKMSNSRILKNKKDMPKYIYSKGYNSKAVSIEQYDFYGNLIYIWDSLSQITENLGIPCGNIVRVCKSNRRSAGGYYWKYKTKEVM